MTVVTTELPQRIGPYEILREIGRGGMGIVYLAREPDEGSLVALKVLPREWTNDAARLKRFQREASTVMKVPHPNIVPIYSVGCANGVWFIAMKYIDGTSLDVLIWNHATGTAPGEQDDETVFVMADDDDGELKGETTFVGPEEIAAPPEPAKNLPDPSTDPDWIFRSVQVIEKVARALNHVHDQGIVHRDIKPGNILIDRSGDAWLADFGLVRDIETSNTQVEGILGTVQYLAPEQVKHGKTGSDHRSDIYSLGVTLYELVTLKRPFDGLDATSTLYALARESPTPPRKLNPYLTEDLERVIQKAMAKHPDARYQTGTAFAEDLQRVRTLEPVRASRAPLFASIRRLGGSNPMMAVVTLVLVVMLMGLVGYCIRNEVREQQRLLAFRTEADDAFSLGQYGQAAESYRMFLRLGGDDSGVRYRLDVCQKALDSATPK